MSQVTALVRPGISLYGYYLPFVTAAGDPAETEKLPVRPVLTWKTHIIDMRNIETGQGVGYNLAFIAGGPIRGVEGDYSRTPLSDSDVVVITTDARNDVVRIDPFETYVEAIGRRR